MNRRIGERFESDRRGSRDVVSENVTFFDFCRFPSALLRTAECLHVRSAVGPTSDPRGTR